MGLSVALVAIEPWWAARWVAIPLRWPRAAYLLTRASPWAWRADRVGGAWFAAGWAAARRPVRDEAGERWLEDPDPPEVRVRLSDPALTGAGLAGHALLAASAGDREQARALLAATPWFDPPPIVARVASEWLAADAATRGDWDEVRAWASRAGTRRGALLDAIARRLLGEPIAGSELAERWRACPELHEPLAAVWARDPARTWPEVDGPPLRVALTWMARARLRLRALGVAALAWDRALVDHPELREGVVAELVELAPKVEPRIVGHTAVGREALQQLRVRAIRALERAVDVTRERTRSPWDLPALDEALIWLATVRLYDEAARTCVEVAHRREIYALVYPAVLDHALAYGERRGQGALVRAVVGWLRSEAAERKRKDALRRLDPLLTPAGGT